MGADSADALRRNCARSLSLRRVALVSIFVLSRPSSRVSSYVEPIYIKTNSDEAETSRYQTSLRSNLLRRNWFRNNTTATMASGLIHGDAIDYSFDPAPTDLERYPRTFTCFGRLPAELRAEIWKATLEPRIIEMKYDLPEGFYAEHDIPVALTVCQESRNILLPHYPLCFGTIFHPAKTRFNFNVDTLYIDNSFEEDIPHLFSAFREVELKELKYVAVDSYFNSPDDGEEFIVHLRRAMRHLKGLEELQIVYDVQILTDRTLGCGQEDHPMEIFDTLPKDLCHPDLDIGVLSSNEDLQEETLWKVKKVKAVYGWRRCPVPFDINGFVQDLGAGSHYWGQFGGQNPFSPDPYFDMDTDGFDGEEEDEMDEDDDDDDDDDTGLGLHGLEDVSSDLSDTDTTLSLD